MQNFLKALASFTFNFTTGFKSVDKDKYYYMKRASECLCLLLSRLPTITMDQN